MLKKLFPIGFILASCLFFAPNQIFAGTVPSAPINLVVSQTASDYPMIRFSWSVSSYDGLTGYTVRYRVAGASDWQVAVANRAINYGNEYYFNYSGNPSLTASTTYEFAVSAWNASGESALATKTFTTVAGPIYDIYTCSDFQSIQYDPYGTYRLHADIDLSQCGYTQIYSFYGTLIGNNHTLYGYIYDHYDQSDVGLFREISDASISNLTIASSTFIGQYRVGPLASYISNSSSLSHINIADSVNISGVLNVGGLAGYLNSFYDNTLSVDQCTSTAKFVSNPEILAEEGEEGVDYNISSIGGLFGSMSAGTDGGSDVGHIVITDSYASSSVLVSNYPSSNIGGLAGAVTVYSGVVEVDNFSSSFSLNTGSQSGQAEGGIFGAVNYFDIVGINPSFRLTNSRATGTITTNQESDILGGLIGGISSDADGWGSSNGSSTISRNYSNLSISGGSYLGGLVGASFVIPPATTTISESYSTGNISGVSYLGGIVGYSQSGRLENTFSTGNITATGNYVGGLVGNNTVYFPASIINSYSTGNVSGANLVGGLIGNNTIDDIHGSFTVSSTTATGDYVGGLIGQNSEINDISSFSNNHWFNSFDKAIGTLSTEGSNSPYWEKASSASVFVGNNINAPMSDWDSSIWSFPSGYYPQLLALPITSLAPVSDTSSSSSATSSNSTTNRSTNNRSSSSGGSVKAQVTNLLTMGQKSKADELMKSFPNLFSDQSSSKKPLSSLTVSNSVFQKTLTKSKDLYYGLAGSGVKTLQQFLNANGFVVSSRGTGSLGKENNKFGPATRAALIKFQKAHGIKPANGYFGPKTRAYIESM